MKRACLVSYSSSDESDVEQNSVSKSESTTKLDSNVSLAPPTKKRRLPPLSASLTPPIPVDNHAEHQGRVRSFPHVEGQYVVHIYVPLVLGRGEALYNLVTEVVCKAREEVKGLWGIGEVKDSESDAVHTSRCKSGCVGECNPAMGNLELHISLSHPILIRAHQREEVKRAVKRIAHSVSLFDASFATFTEFTNDENTRTFLAMEIGAGHMELRNILDLLNPTLRFLRQKEFYTDPKFHASIAWALLGHSRSPSPQKYPSSTTTFTSGIPVDFTDQSPSPPPDSFHRIIHFPPLLVSTLNATYAQRLSTARTGGFLVDKIAVRIGKEVTVWSLKG